MTLTAAEILDREMARMQANREIRCPNCNYLYDCEDTAHHISYHGDREPQRADCPNCEHPFMVDECVERTFEVMELTETEAPDAKD